MESERHDGLSARPRIFIPCKKYEYSCKKTESAIEKDSKILTHLEAEQRTFKRYTEVTAQAPFSAFQPSVQIGDIVLDLSGARRRCLPRKKCRRCGKSIAALKLRKRAGIPFAPQAVLSLRKKYPADLNAVSAGKRHFSISPVLPNTADCVQNTVFERNSNFPRPQTSPTGGSPILSFKQFFYRPQFHFYRFVFVKLR